MSPLRLYTLGQIRGLTSRHRRAHWTKRTPSAQSTSRSAKKGFSLHNVHLSEDEFLSFPYGVLSKVWRGSQEGKLQGKQRRFPLSWKSQVQWSSFYTISDFKLSVMLLSGSARATAQKILAPAQTNWESASAQTGKGRVRAQSVSLHARISLHQVNTTLAVSSLLQSIWLWNDILSQTLSPATSYDPQTTLARRPRDMSALWHVLCYLSNVEISIIITKEVACTSCIRERTQSSCLSEQTIYNKILPSSISTASKVPQLSGFSFAITSNRFHR